MPFQKNIKNNNLFESLLKYEMISKKLKQITKLKIKKQ